MYSFIYVWNCREYTRDTVHTYKLHGEAFIWVWYDVRMHFYSKSLTFLFNSWHDLKCTHFACSFFSFFVSVYGGVYLFNLLNLSLSNYVCFGYYWIPIKIFTFKSFIFFVFTYKRADVNRWVFVVVVDVVDWVERTY